MTIAKKHSEFLAGVKALKAARLPRCDLNKFVQPPLHDNNKPIHMIVTTPDRFETCYRSQVSILMMRPVFFWLLALYFICPMSFESICCKHSYVCNLCLLSNAMQTAICDIELFCTTVVPTLPTLCADITPSLCVLTT